jgi:hypothetical protein
VLRLLLRKAEQFRPELRTGDVAVGARPPPAAPCHAYLAFLWLFFDT